MDVQTYIMIGQIALNVVLTIVSICLLLKRRKKATTIDEQEEVDQIILATLQDSLQTINKTLKPYNVGTITNRRVLKLTKKALKEEKEDGKTENA